MAGLIPPHTLITVTSPGLGNSFGGYNIDRQRVAAPAAPRERIATIRVPPGRARADVEAQHRWFADREAPWTVEGGRHADGVNYWVTYLDASGIESDRVRAGAQIQTVPVMGSWLACNSAWWLAAWLQAIPAMSARLGERSFAWELAGRDYEVTRTKQGRPSKRGSGTILLNEHFGHDQAQMLEVIAASGRQVALCRKLGDRYLGTLEVTDYADLPGARLAAGFEFIQTGGMSQIADYNLPAGIVLDGSDDMLTSLDHADLDPASGSWSFFFAGAGLTSAGSDYYLSKGSPVAAAGYGIRTTGSANQVEVTVRDASTSATVTATVAALFDSFDTTPEGHVIGASYDATLNTLTAYVDGVQVGTPAAASLGAIANARMLIAGANNNGSDAGTAFAAGLYRAHGVYARALSAADHVRLAGYLRGHPGIRAPGNANVFYDARDLRSFSGVDDQLRDMNGALDATLVGSPVTRGVPANLGVLDA